MRVNINNSALAESLCHFKVACQPIPDSVIINSKNLLAIGRVDKFANNLFDIMLNNSWTWIVLSKATDTVMSAMRDNLNVRIIGFSARIAINHRADFSPRNEQPTQEHFHENKIHFRCC